VKVVIVGPAFPLRGGIAHHVYNINKALRYRGHWTETISYSRLYPAFLFPGKTMLDNSQDALDVNALQILDSVNPFTWIRTVATIRSLKPDIVLFEWWTPFLAPVIGTIARLLRQSGLKCVFECHNIFPHEPTVFAPPMVHYGLEPAEAFIVFSKRNLAYLHEFFPDRISFCTPLIAPFKFPGSARREGTTILFFGIVRPYKGLDVLLEALRIAVTQVKCKLRIAGEFYDPIDKYTRMIREFRLESFVEVNDRYIPNEEIAGFFEQADVLVLPYREATQSGVLRMALASGLPVIASDVGSFADEVEQNVNGLLVRPADPARLADALIQYFKKGLGPRFAQNLRLANVPRDGPELVDIIESLATGPGLSH
jgi:glycosyltransferase involved in cell wall biosynthesis